MALLPIRAITQLTPPVPQNRYYVSAYFLPDKPHYDEKEGEIFAYFAVLGTFSSQSEALAYAEKVMTLTKHRGVIVTEGMHWSTLSTRFQPLRNDSLTTSLSEDVKQKQRKMQEQEALQKKLVAETEAKLQQEADKTTVPFFARILYNHIKTEDRINQLKRELVYMEELQQEQTKLIQEHITTYPEHKLPVVSYLEDEFGANYAEQAQRYL